ncbi:glycosyltransferase family 39 protein [Geobacter sp. AOG2]|uniref:glycosyltransferase family 39 protein n=1 Tax=Geobacter sp. AOG2 TaxID=1566347 RepID=UPI001CC73C61|nr:glycosyltransferase family 39 protein [Geobacter sp. AOG2]GFE60318.1 hypothetical protein AOG2_09060 [Geobacter sp. AOG2]
MTDILKNRYVPLVALAVFLGVFFFMATAQLDMPGLYYDECIFVNAATGGTSGTFIHKVVLGVPVMIMGYIGALKSFFYYPVFHYFGVSPQTIRLPVIMLSSATIVFCFLLGKRLFGGLGALLLAGLVATDPAFIYNVRLDFGPVALMLLFKMAALYFFFEFLATRRTLFAGLLVLALLLGFYDKLNFIWFTSAFLVAAGLLYGKELLAAFPGNRKAHVALLALFLACMTFGVFALVVPTLSTPSGIPPQSIGSKIRYVAKIFLSTMNGSWPFTAVLDRAEIPRTFANFLVFPVAAALLASLWSGFGPSARGENRAEDKAMWFFALVFAIIFAEIVITKQGGGPHHVMMLYPLHYLVLFAGVRPLRRLLPARYLALGGMGCLLAYLAGVGAQLYADTEYSAAFREKRHFTAAWDPAIYRLSDLLEQAGPDLVVCADWGVQTQLFSLAPPAGRGKYVEGSGILKRVDPDDPSGAEFLYQRMFKGVNTCVVLLGKDAGMDRAGGRNFEKLYRNRLPSAAFHEKVVSADGKELYEVYGLSGH